MTANTLDTGIDSLMERLTSMFDRWLAEFEQRPVAMALKIVLVLWFLRWSRRNLL